ncbi:MAG: division/cell wall cluster transcriptional repressor MraZ [Lautropia sp.]|nr:division/cell wall cluster transcriptional repressor MraZ [Lautropia sp.]
MFEGSFPLSLDTKGRLTIPSSWRGLLEEQGVRKLVLTRHFGSYLRVYPLPEWERVREHIAATFTAKDDRTRRLLIGTAETVEIDGAGRILVSPILRRAAKLDRKVVMLGDISRFELWDEQTLEAYLDEQASAGLPEGLFDIPGL